MNCSDLERKLISLPSKIGGIRISISDIADRVWVVANTIKWSNLKNN